MCQRLQPYVPGAATLCTRGCNRMCQGLQPYVCRHELSMAHEGVDGTIGLGNALMLARPWSPMVGAPAAFNHLNTGLL